MSCTSQSEKSVTAWQEICQRDDGDLSRISLYRMKIPSEWVRQDPSTHESLTDTTKANCTFTWNTPAGPIMITIYSFPYHDVNQRVPPEAQIARWKRQFQRLDIEQVTPQAFSGFSGLLFEGSGQLDSEDKTMMGWTMGISPMYTARLRAPELVHTRADWTIKIVGPANVMALYRSELFATARTFELIKEIQ